MFPWWYDGWKTLFITIYYDRIVWVHLAYGPVPKSTYVLDKSQFTVESHRLEHRNILRLELSPLSGRDRMYFRQIDRQIT